LGVGRLVDEPTVTSIAAEYGRTPAQVLVRWNLQLNNAVVSRSSKPERVAENLDVSDFTLGGQDPCLRADPRPPVQRFNETVEHRIAAGEVPRDHAVDVLSQRRPLQV
jgi:aryl-alcohol dehydrogenase-like predicted oxidoreductase